MAQRRVSVANATERSIKKAHDAGALDLDLSAGPIAALRKIARLLDDPDFPLVMGKLDNVSLPTYLRYCTELRLTPASQVEEKKEAGGGKLAQLRSIAGGKTARV